MRFIALVSFAIWAQFSQAQVADKALKELEKLQSEYNEALSGYLARNRAAKTKDEREALWEKRPTKDEFFVPRFFAIASEAPGTEAAFRALLWIVQVSGDEADHRRSLDLLLSDHMSHPGLGPVTARFIGAPAPTSDPSAAVIMRRIIEESPHPEVRGQTAFHLAKWLMYHHPLEQEQEIIALLRSAVSDCEAVPAGFPFPNKMLAEVAEAELFVFQYLRVGRKVPEIEGEDLVGEPFRLSDLQGNVVLLDFWGHW